MPCWVRCLTLEVLDHFARGGGGVTVGQWRQERNKLGLHSRDNALLLALFSLKHENMGLWRCSVDGGSWQKGKAFSDSVTQATESLLWFMTVLFKGRRKLELKLRPWSTVFHCQVRARPPGVKTELVLWPCWWTYSSAAAAIFCCHYVVTMTQIESLDHLYPWINNLHPQIT